MSGVATARIPKGAVASVLENAGKKKTIFFEGERRKLKRIPGS